MKALAPVAYELAAWREAGLTLPIWWRDDDAVEPTPALDRLLALARSHGAPLHLAVIPSGATPELAERLAGERNVRVLPHGLSHRNHAPQGRRKAEFGAHRPIDEMTAELATGLERTERLFGERMVPILVPPWNRIARALPSRLPALGFRALSTYKPRRKAQPSPGLLQVNCHLDPIHWRGSRSVRNPARLALVIARALEGRRTGRWDNDEPYGLLTHHLVHDDAIWRFTDEFLAVLGESGVARWTPPLPAAM